MDNSYKESKTHIQTTIQKIINDVDNYHKIEIKSNDKTE
jgi:hypothetical protein